MIDPATDLVATGALALVDNASRLGLTWKIRLATVNTTGANPTVIVDGDDTTTLNAVPMFGNMAIGSRVYVLLIPPDGVYIVGQVAAWESGSETLTFASATSSTRAVTFNRKFLAAPKVFTNLPSASGEVTGWHSRARSITTSGFVLVVFKDAALAANAWTAREVQWHAVAP
ncbi:MAG TPA: hypothetical protein VK899_03955 [Gemmatimonadales bacterium]|nr:hypothetical protein [Gemmatimonadales bacterium]